MSARVLPLSFACGQDRIAGLLHLPQRPRPRGVVVIAGAPQYRVGSHRQFVLLARELAAAGFPVLRFDCRGTGDSDGDFAGFEDIADDIRAAIDAIFAGVPGLREVVLWGLCDGASATAFYAPGDPRVAGIVLVNPWVRSAESLAGARLSHHYRRRLLSPEFWRKLGGGRIDLRGAARELIATLGTAFLGRGRGDDAAARSLPQRVADSIRDYRGRILIVLSGGDLVAREFESAVLGSNAARRWAEAPNMTLRRLDSANHTYSTGPWRAQVHRWTVEWLRRGDEA